MSQSAKVIRCVAIVTGGGALGSVRSGSPGPRQGRALYIQAKRNGLFKEISQDLALARSGLAYTWHEQIRTVKKSDQGQVFCMGVR